MRGEPGLIEIDAVFVTQRKSKESQEKKAKKRKPKTHPHKPRAGHPPCGCEVFLAEQLMITDRLCEKKESKRRPGHPSINDPCANATLAAAGVDIQQNIVQAQGTISLGRMMGVTGGSYNHTVGLWAALFNYATLVGTGGPQDVKIHPGPGTSQQRVDAGNISFGVTCSFGGAFCQFAAGLAQTVSGNPNFQGTLKTGFDTPSDNAAIRVGQAMRAAGCHE